MEDIPKIAHSKLVSTDEIVHKGPCLVTGFQVTGGSTNATASLYDGINTNGEHKAKIKAATAYSMNWGIERPVDFDHGIYVDLSGNGAVAIVSFIALSRKIAT